VRGTSTFRGICACLPACLQVNTTGDNDAVTAAALQQALVTHLASASQGRLAHVSSAWVRGCVQVFLWAAWVPPPQLRDAAGQGPSGITAGGQALSLPAINISAQGAPAGAAPLSVQPGAHATTADRVSKVLSHDLEVALAAGAAAAGMQGDVDVQVGCGGDPQRYEIESTAAGTTPVPESTGREGTTAGCSRLQVQCISPPCLTLLSTISRTERPYAAFQVHLSSQQQVQRVRVLVLAAGAGAALVDDEREVMAGQGKAVLRVQVPLQGLAAANNRTGYGEGPSRDRPAHWAPSNPVGLRLIITTPTLPNSSISQAPLQPPQLLASATLLAAPALLASELCGLHALIEHEGVDARMTGASVWSQHWQPLMDDICLCLEALGSADAASAASGTAEGAMVGFGSQACDLVTARLCDFFSDVGMAAWLHQLHSLSSARAGQPGDKPPLQEGEQPGNRGAVVASNSREAASAESPGWPGTPAQMHPAAMGWGSLQGQSLDPG
jgi:hypothetical protein